MGLSLLLETEAPEAAACPRPLAHPKVAKYCGRIEDVHDAHEHQAAGLDQLGLPFLVLEDVIHDVGGPDEGWNETQRPCFVHRIDLRW
jgi:hypothetical protein